MLLLDSAKVAVHADRHLSSRRCRKIQNIPENPNYSEMENMGVCFLGLDAVCAISVREVHHLFDTVVDKRCVPHEYN